ncbi:MAG: hypothetical protein IPK25_16945 [Saprospiraceae bacterium]|nr:hypothetical protein [Saprospiraceae bacterium]
MCGDTSYIAWAGLGARQKLLEGIVDNIANFIEGKWVNPVYRQHNDKNYFL